ncbi:MAG TPA: PrgI family protein [Candidatus Paceibacterota bacterium]
MVAKVPQFIEVEDKIFGPLTFKQFLYVAGGAAGCFVIWTLLPKVIAVFLVLPMAGLALALAFYQVNNRPFVITLESFIRYHLGGKLYLWSKKARKTKVASKEAVQTQKVFGGSKLTQSKLSELAWSLDVSSATNQTNNQ